MTDISKLHALLDWKLLGGSHEWPGPHGGTCINEAAIVAAGFEYQQVSNAKDLPPCFSAILGAMLICLNDIWFHHSNAMSRDETDTARTKSLMPFVLKLPGSARKHEVELDRLRFIAYDLFGPTWLDNTLEALEDNYSYGGGPCALEDCNDDDHYEIMSKIVNLAMGRIPLDRVLDVLSRAFDIGGTAASIPVDVAVQRMQAARELAKA